MRYNTILLDQDTWDLMVDAYGNIAVAAPPYSLSQDVASAIKLFFGELWYNKNKGIKYFEDIFGKRPPIELVKKYMEDAALSVPGVVTANVVITIGANRAITGYIEFVDEEGIKNSITI